MEALGKTLEQIGTEAFKKMQKNKERSKGFSGEEFVTKLHTIMEEEPEKETEVSKTASVEERAEMKDVEKDFSEEGKLPMELSYANFDVETEVARDEKEFQELLEGERRIDLENFEREQREKNEPPPEEPIEIGNPELLAEQTSESLGSNENAIEEDVNVIRELCLREIDSPHLVEIKNRFSKWYQEQWFKKNKSRKGIDEGDVNNAIEELIRENLEERWGEKPNDLRDVFFDHENEVCFAEEISKSFFWQRQQNRGKSSEAVTEKILEDEFPKMRKEVPKEETFNKYGKAARQIEIAAFNEYGAIEEINESEMPQGYKLLRG